MRRISSFMTLSKKNYHFLILNNFYLIIIYVVLKKYKKLKKMNLQHIYINLKWNIFANTSRN